MNKPADFYLWFGGVDGWQVTSFDPATDPAIGFKPETKLYVIKTEYDRLRELLSRINDCSTMGPELRDELERTLTE